MKEAFVITSLGDEFQVHQRFEPELGKMRVELYGDKNTFLAGKLLDLDQDAMAIHDVLEYWKGRKAGYIPETKEPPASVGFEFDSPDVYGPPQLGDAKSQANA